MGLVGKAIEGAESAVRYAVGQRPFEVEILTRKHVRTGDFGFPATIYVGRNRNGGGERRLAEDEHVVTISPGDIVRGWYGKVGVINGEAEYRELVDYEIIGKI